MSIIVPALPVQIRVGPAEVFVGDPLTAGMMTSIGMLEGERRLEVEFADNILTATEHTGAVPHDVRSNISRAEIVCRVKLNASGAAIWPKINPLGTKGGGSSYPQPKPTNGVLLIPHSELGGALAYTGGQWVRTAGNGYPAASGAAAAPVHSVWLWKADVRHGNVPYGAENGGESFVDVTWRGWIDISKPDGSMVYYIGDPRTNSTPIPVTL